MSNSKISVIIPVYNAIEFLEIAVKSAIFLPHVGEVILIDDGSTDGSFDMCKDLSTRFRKVRFFNHGKGINLGVSCSRNGGITNSIFPYISFLDADDYYLSNRFDEFSRLVNLEIDFDGLYESIQYFNGFSRIYGINKMIPSKKLFHYLIRGTYGHFHTNGLVVKRELLIKSGLFVESLDLHQDSDLWLKLAFYGNLISGEIGVPVSMVRKHDGNRIWKGITNNSRLKQWQVTWGWARNEPIGILNKFLILIKLLKYKLGSLKE